MMGDIHPKRSKSEVDYGAAKSESECCRVCHYFECEAPKRCLKVEGEISPGMWCRLFEPGKVRLTDGDNDDDDY